MTRLATLLLCVPLCLPLGLALSARAATVEVIVDNVRAATGHMRIALCDAAHFTKTSGCAFAGASDAAAPQTIVRIDGVTPGVYAAQGYLDEHDWHELRRDFIGRPKEGIGFSRDAPFRFGPPDFSDASFTVAPDGVTRVRMTLRYFD